MHEICKDLSPSSQCDLSTDQVCVGLSRGHRHMLSKSREYGVGGAGSGTCWVHTMNLISHIICETRAIHECIIKCMEYILSDGYTISEYHNIINKQPWKKDNFLQNLGEQTPPNHGTQQPHTGNSISTIQQGHPRYPSSCSPELKVKPSSPPNLLEARFSNPCPVTALHARTSQTGHPSLRIPRIRQPRMSGHERIPVKRHQRERKKNLKKRAPSEPWEASYAEFCSYWPGLGGRSYWNYYFTSRDFHSIQTSCLADFTLRGTRHVFLVFFFFSRVNYCIQ